MKPNIPINFRTATVQDATPIALLHARSWQENYRGSFTDEFLDHQVIPERLEVWKKRFEHPNDQQYIILAHQEKQLCGFACTYLDHDPEWGGLLDNLHVSASCQKWGIGQTLLQKSIEKVYQQNPSSKFYLWVLKANVSAIRFYEKNGGIRMEETTFHNPGGGQSIIYRYVWENLLEWLEG